ncbi:MAG: glycine betaine/L-proline ABC transporter ATP-binding protein [Rhizobiales bacterium]|nr:glycine betaine/L-proline ABC transporter ATP-binding protein [Hyphomicrobiales bacterium]
MTVKLEASRLFKVYGTHPAEAIELARQGLPSREILQKTHKVLAVSDVSLAVREGEIFTIMGLSGSGKSTLVRCLNRLVEPSAGAILIDGEDIAAVSPARLREIRRTKIAMVFQNFALLPHKSVLENVEFGLYLRGEPAAPRRTKALEAIERVGLSEWIDRRPENLSGGMKQRVGLARALANDPDILLMDEPFSALDPLIRADLQNALLKLQRDIKKTIVFITHDFHEAVKLSDRVAIMREGRFVQVGTPQEIVLRPVDDYVANFARDLDRSKMLCAGDIAHMRIPLVAADLSASEVLDRLRKGDKAHALVVDAQRMPLGYVCRQELANAGGGLAGRTVAAYQHDTVVSAAGSSVLTTLFPSFEQRLPVAILDGHGRAIGAMDASDVLMQLSDMAEGRPRRVLPAAGGSIEPASSKSV